MTLKSEKLRWKIVDVFKRAGLEESETSLQMIDEIIQAVNKELKYQRKAMVEDLRMEKASKRRKRIPIGFVETRKVRLKTIEDGDINCAYDDGFDQAVKELNNKLKKYE